MTDRGQTDPIIGCHTETLRDLVELIDVEGGLREVLLPLRHARTGRPPGLDVEAGLYAITGEPVVIEPEPHAEEQRGVIAEWLLSLADADRLAIRSHAVFACLAFTFRVVRAIEITRQFVSLLESGRRGQAPPCWAEVRALEDSLVQIHDMYPELPVKPKLTHVDVLVLEIADTAGTADRRRLLRNARDLFHDLNKVFDQAHHQTGDLAVAIALGQTSAQGLVRILGHLGLTGLHLGLVADLATARCQAGGQDLDVHLDRARNDFTGADLTHADIARISLTGVRWSMATRWPSETWRAQLLQESREISDGIYEVRPGTTNVPAHAYA
jgi:hypothetical protein